MDAKYPIYVLELDDFSFREFSEPGELNYCEETDVRDGIYEGWDSCGRHFAVCWDDACEGPTAQVDRDPSVSAFEAAVNHYAEICHRENIVFGRDYTPRKYEICDPSYLRTRLDQIRQLT